MHQVRKFHLYRQFSQFFGFSVGFWFVTFTVCIVLINFVFMLSWTVYRSSCLSWSAIAYSLAYPRSYWFIEWLEYYQLGKLYIWIIPHISQFGLLKVPQARVQQPIQSILFSVPAPFEPIYKSFRGLVFQTRRETTNTN